MQLQSLIIRGFQGQGLEEIIEILVQNTTHLNRDLLGSGWGICRNLVKMITLALYTVPVL